VNRHAGIREGVGREPVGGIAVPAHHGGHELRHHHLRVGGEAGQAAAEREAHPEAADEHAGPPPRGHRRAGQLGEPLLRVVLPARHQLHAADADREGAVVLVERERRAVGGGGPVAEDGGLHAGQLAPK
jgi:hypothetical protein